MTDRAASLAQATDVTQIQVPETLWPELRSDHAGETGAVWIYRGILSVTRDADVRAFAQRHLETESEHLSIMEGLVPPGHRSRALPVWRVAGWLTGALPGVVGPSAVFQTIEAVETFVDRHYAAQTAVLRGDARFVALHDLLERCRLDEVAHRDDASSRVGDIGRLGRLWAKLVGQGSRIGVAIASRV